MSRNIKILNREFVPAGTIVIEQGTPGSRAFIIEQGKVEVFLSSKDNKHLKLAELGAESIVGEIAAISDGMRSANVKTIEDSILVYISAHDLDELMLKSEKTKEKILGMAQERINNTNQIIKDMSPSMDDIALNISNKSEMPEEVILLVDKLKNKED